MDPINQYELLSAIERSRKERVPVDIPYRDVVRAMVAHSHLADMSRDRRRTSQRETVR